MKGDFNMISYRKKNNDIVIGKDIRSKNKVFLKEQDRLYNTLLIGDTGTKKVDYSLKPMLINDIKSKSCSAIFITKNKDFTLELKEEFNESKLAIIELNLNDDDNKSLIDWQVIERVVSNNKSLIINCIYDELNQYIVQIVSFIIDKVQNILSNRNNKDKPIYFYIDDFDVFLSDNLIEFIKINKDLNIGMILSTRSRLLIKENYVHNIDEYVKNLILYPGINRKEAKYYSILLNSLNKGNTNMEDFTMGGLIYKPISQFTVCLMNDGVLHHPQVIRYLSRK